MPSGKPVHIWRQVLCLGRKFHTQLTYVGELKKFPLGMGKRSHRSVSHNKGRNFKLMFAVFHLGIESHIYLPGNVNHARVFKHGMLHMCTYVYWQRMKFHTWAQSHIPSYETSVTGLKLAWNLPLVPSLRKNNRSLFSLLQHLITFTCVVLDCKHHFLN
jgi:hypothetical protein